MRFDDALRNRETKAGTGSTAGVVGAVEGFEQVRKVIRADTWSTVGDRQPRLRVSLSAADANHSAIRAVAHCVVEQVADRPFKHVCFSINRDARVGCEDEFGATFLGERSERCNGVRKQLC